MPTLLGNWVGSGYARARIECDYSESVGGSGSTYTAWFYIRSESRMWDTTNNWSISGDLGSLSGSGLNINLGADEREYIGSVTRTVTSRPTVSASVSGINYIGQTVSATFTLPTSGRPPVVNDFRAFNVTSSSFLVDITSATGNGTVLSWEVQYSLGDRNSPATKSASGLNDIQLSGLTKAGTYYYRVRARNSVDWSNFTGWKTVTTQATAPGVPKSTWSVTNIGFASASVTGCAVADTGGRAVTAYEVQYNTSASHVGATSKSAASNPTITGLLNATVYYARIRAKNSVGWGGYTAWKSFRTLNAPTVRYNGVYKPCEVWVKYAGTWRKATMMVRKDGVWR